MAVNMTALAITISDWVAGGDGKIRGSDPEGNEGGGGESTVVAMSLDLTTAGRLGFYVDYSELATTGTHTFYVIRTHGTTGAVSCGYSTGGDTHTTVSGTLSWADGEADIKSFTATVSSKSAGDHRMWALLDTPTGGAVLHFGATHTRAYGVIDDGTVAGDTDAVFYDSAATGGTGTQADPYDSYLDAVANLGAKRYLYGKGTTVVDGSHTDNITGNTVQTLPTPANRASEATRVYVQGWPGFTWNITGDGGTTNIGFFSGAVTSYHTYRNIDISGLDNTSRTNCVGIHYNASGTNGINVEHCTFDDINGKAGSNHSGFGPFNVDGYKMWRCTTSNIRDDGSTTENTSGLQTYQGTNGSVQRCTCTDAYHGVYQKQAKTGGGVSTRSAFNTFIGTTEGVAYREAGAGNDGNYFTLIHNNLFKNNTNRGIFNWMTLGPTGLPSNKYGIFNNVFDTCAASDRNAIHFRGAYNTQIYNNAFIDCRAVWGDKQDGTGWSSPDVEYADYNVEFGTTWVQKYTHEGTDYADAAALFAATGFAGNDVNADPVFTNRATNDYTLDTGSAAIGAGISGVDAGIYLTGFEVIGAE